MSVSLCVRNQQRNRPVNVSLLRRVLQELVRRQFSARKVELGVYLVAAPRMTQLNEQYLRHRGSTDVITFPYSEPADSPCCSGDIFLCVDEAVTQGRQYKVSWQAELVRYLIHGLLHLQGYDDQSANQRREMKREENRLLREMVAEFNLEELAAART